MGGSLKRSCLSVHRHSWLWRRIYTRTEGCPYGKQCFWSVTMYKDGFAQGENYNINSSFAKQDANGNYILNFGKDSAKNFLRNLRQAPMQRCSTLQKPYFDGSGKFPKCSPLLVVSKCAEQVCIGQIAAKFSLAGIKTSLPSEFLRCLTAFVVSSVSCLCWL